MKPVVKLQSGEAIQATSAPTSSTFRKRPIGIFAFMAAICSGVISCTDKNVEEFGIVSIPFMAGAGFISILLLQVAEWRADRYYRRALEAEGAEGR